MNQGKKYVKVGMSPIKDNNLSFAALGLLTYLLHFDPKEEGPDNTWKLCTIPLYELIKEKKTGACALNSIMNELINAGYVERWRTSRSKGFCYKISLNESFSPLPQRVARGEQGYKNIA